MRLITGLSAKLLLFAAGWERLCAGIVLVGEVLTVVCLPAEAVRPAPSEDEVLRTVDVCEAAVAFLTGAPVVVFLTG
ncbi:MAG: hypothetical protein IJO53_05240 [Clostridia bacterium]|nr:hypothetical protein [Clostridia bacterium]